MEFAKLKIFKKINYSTLFLDEKCKKTHKNPTLVIQMDWIWDFIQLFWNLDHNASENPNPNT